MRSQATRSSRWTEVSEALADHLGEGFDAAEVVAVDLKGIGRQSARWLA